jgi:hypothetical protein
VVRGPAAVLTGLGAALAYFLAAPALPALASADLAVLVAGTAGLVAVVLCTAVVVPAVESPFSLAIGFLGAVLLVAALSVAEVGAGATPFEAMLYGCIGVGFAAVLDSPALAVALPLFVAAVDAASVVGGGPGGLLVGGGADAGDPLTLELPGWGGGLPAARVSAADVIFLAAFAAYAHRFGLRRRATIAGMLGGFVLALVLGVVLDRDVSALPLVAAGYLLPNVDRLGALFHRPSEG